MTNKIKTIAIWLLAVAISIASASTVIWYIYTQEYVQDSQTTATKGILFQKTLKLKAYSIVSSGNGWLGEYDRYSRSDRHADVITVYCKEFCKDK